MSRYRLASAGFLESRHGPAAPDGGYRHVGVFSHAGMSRFVIGYPALEGGLYPVDRAHCVHDPRAVREHAVAHRARGGDFRPHDAHVRIRDLKPRRLGQNGAIRRLAVEDEMARARPVAGKGFARELIDRRFFYLAHHACEGEVPAQGDILVADGLDRPPSRPQDRSSCCWPRDPTPSRRGGPLWA